MKQVIIAVLLVVVLSRNTLPQNANGGAQDTFCGAQLDASLTAPLPRPVIGAVMMSEEGREARAATEAKGQKLNPAALKGAKIQLGAAADAFYLVAGPPSISGLDNTWFWVVRQWGNKAEVLLWASGRCLQLSNKRTLGFRDIEVTLISTKKNVTEIYRYNGTEYKVWRHKSPLTEVPLVRH